MANRYLETDKALLLLGMPDVPHIRADIEEHIPVAEDLVDQFCRTRFDLEEAKERTFSGGSAVLAFGYFLKTLTLVEVLDEDGVVLDELDDVVPQPDEPRYGAYRWIERRGNLAFPAGLGNIRVTGDWGWATADIPRQITYATALTIKHLHDRRLINEFVKSEVGGGRVIETVDQDRLGVYVPAIARSLLGQFRNSRVLG